MKEGKNLLLGYVAIIVLIVLYQLYFMKTRAKNPPPKEMKTEEVKIQKPEKKIAKESPKPLETKAISPTIAVEKGGVKEQEIQYENDFLKVSFTNIGGDIKEIRVKKYNVWLRPKKGNLTRTAIVEGNTKIDMSNIPFEYEMIKNGVRFYYKQDSVVYEKVYTFNNKNYTISLMLLPEKEFYYGIAGFDTDEKVPDKKRFIGAIVSMGGKPVTVSLRKIEKASSNRIFNGMINWAGFKTKYFIISVLPENYATETVVGKFNDLPFVSTRYNNKVTVYAGPLEYNKLVLAKKGFENSIYFGMTLLRPISKGIFFTIVFLHKGIRNYGLVIIIFTILMMLILSPINMVSYKSMRSMSKIQPEIAKLRQKYKKDPQKLNAATMELYKKYGVNPFSGCLPLLIQMPVFFALYAVLNSTIELKGAPFALWIKDLSLRDPYFILPILMGITMFIQQKFFSPQGATSEQRGLTFMMPIILTFIFASLPSGLVLYWFVYNLLMILQQYFIKKQAEGG